MENIKIVDAVMGTGKSSWAIQYMNENPGLTFLFVTPYLTEIDRIKRETTQSFWFPENHGEGKLQSLKELLSRGENIVTTRQLFLYIDEEVKNLIRANEYVCIMDEELNVIKLLAMPWSQKRKSHRKDWRALKRIFEPVWRTKLCSKAEELMWTTYQDYESGL